MKKTILFLLTALAFMATGCATDDDDKSSSNEKTIQPGNDERPSWTLPNAQDYEQTMTVFLNIQKELMAYMSEQDLVCAMIDGTIRGVTAPAFDNDKWIVPLVIFGNGTAKITLSYYCANLKRIFTVDWINFDSSLPPTGTSEIYSPAFVK